jgi:hypothetical protein
MSGRGAADALAKMTQVAGGVFLVTSLALTMIQGAAQTSSSRSVFDSLPSAPAFHLPNFGGGEEKAAPPSQNQNTPAHDPLESSVPAPTQTASNPIQIAPSAASATERAGPVASSPAPAATPRPAAAAPAARPATTATATPAAAHPATTTAASRPAATSRSASTTRPASNGVASGVTVPTETDNDPLAPVRRDSRAGPDQ